MFSPVAFLIGLRYTRAKRRNHYISFISLSSMIGIGLGIAVLITVLSVMNGFDTQIRQQIFSMAKQLSVSNPLGRIEQPDLLEKRIQQHPEVLATSPITGKESLLTAQGQVQPAFINGILPKSYIHVSQLAEKMILGSLADLKPHQFHIILGRTLAASLGVQIGDKVTVISPEANLSVVGMLPRFKIFQVSGIFSSEGTEYDRSLAFIHLTDAQALYRLNNTVGEIQVKLKDLYLAPLVNLQLSHSLPSSFIIQDWTLDYGSLFDAIKLEKNMMFIILFLIIVVAAFNLVSSLVMMVNDKKSDIAILRTLGADKSTIMAIFMIQGLVVGCIGIVLGVSLGMYLAYNATEIVNFLENIFHVKFIASSVYSIDYLPSELHASDVARITFFSFLICFLATLYPAWRAASQNPAEALRYE